MSSSALQLFRSQLRAHSSAQKAKDLSRFFKTGKGEYGEGDLFLGVKVPETRSVVKLHGMNLTERDAINLLHSKYHEERLAALLILVNRFKKGSEEMKKQIYDTYLGNTRWINNWDLVDLSAEHIVGAFLDNGSKRPLDVLARSKDLWERRIAIVSTFHYIKQSSSEQTFHIADKLIDDENDLIHKAVGWMLREVGKRCSLRELEGYLKPRYAKMPRTMFRYAIERFPEPRRQQYLKGSVR